MGMAASQARYLGLTARKTNVEYEGQQVNQQRTALANESAGLFRQLMTLDAPTAPAQNDYYTDIYTYSDPVASDGNVTVSSIQENTGSNPLTYTVNIKYKEDVLQYGCMADQKVTVINDGEKIQLANGTTFDIEEWEPSQSVIDKMNEACGQDYNSKDNKYYSFYNPVSKTRFYINVDKSGFNIAEKTEQTVDNLFSAISTQIEVTDKLENVTVSKSESGLYNQMYWTDESGYSHTVTLSSGQEYDEQAYNNAMDQYRVDIANYEAEIARINAKTEELQQTDRTLELRLKQLDTEQEALQTELDSVKKVIDKNVDNIFKTFQ